MKENNLKEYLSTFQSMLKVILQKHKYIFITNTGSFVQREFSADIKDIQLAITDEDRARDRDLSITLL